MTVQILSGVMAGLVPAIHAFGQDVDARVKPAHDDGAAA